jgi:hypothetical protein
MDYYDEVQSSHDPSIYNLTTTLTLHIDHKEAPDVSSTIELDVPALRQDSYPLNMKMCKNHRVGRWVPSVNKCYYTYRLSKLTVVIEPDTTGWKLADDYVQTEYERYEPYRLKKS